ncbi:ABC transporter ATP-binding protein [Oceanobacillus sp. CAU 1775]
MIRVEAVRKQYGEKTILTDISFSLKEREILGIIGPNGSGKSTLLKLLSGVEPPSSGKVYFKNNEVQKYTRKEIAKSVAVLQQEALPMIGFTVREVVEMGRFPFQNWLGEDLIDVDSFIDSILDKMNLTALSDRHLEQLSGGERQRVGLAKTMAQSPNVLMLDEPTTYLDIGHQIHLMDRIHSWQREEEMTVISVLHDLNLATLYCDRLLLLNNGRVEAIGTPYEIIQEDLIEKVYGIRPIITTHPSNGLPQIILEGEQMINYTAEPKKKLRI